VTGRLGASAVLLAAKERREEAGRAGARRDAGRAGAAGPRAPSGAAMPRALAALQKEKPATGSAASTASTASAVRRKQRPLGIDQPRGTHSV
jgi:hypothetical protein